MPTVEMGLYFRVVKGDLIEKVGGKIVDSEEIHGKSVPGREKSRCCKGPEAGMLQEQQGGLGSRTEGSGV